MRAGLLALAVGCGGGATLSGPKSVPPAAPATPEEPAPQPDAPGLDASAKADLRVKRWRQLSLDLRGVLRLSEDALCRETGLYDCTDLHVVPLGGVSIENGLYAPRSDFSVTTGLALERVVLQACWNRLELDRAGPAEVFTAVDLHATTVPAPALDAQSTALFRGFLARDPSAAELAGARALAAEVESDGGTATEWALALCFALGTSTEFLLY